MNMSRRDDREEPNLRFSPDKTTVFSSRSLFGSSYVYRVEMKKAEKRAAADGEGHGGAGAAVAAAACEAWEVG
jgi:hypothetical protein